MKYVTKVVSLVFLSSIGVFAEAHAGTTKMPTCLVYPNTNGGSVPCTGVVAVDSATGNPLSWQSLFSGISVSGVSNPAASTIGSAPGSVGSLTSYVGSDNLVHSWMGDTTGHPGVSIFGTPTVTLAAPLPVGTNTIGAVNVNGTIPVSGTVSLSGGSIANTAFGAKLLDNTGAAFGTSANPVYVTGLSGGGVTSSVSITGTLPAFATPPTVTVGNFPSTQAVSNAGTFAVQNTAALPAGNNLVGKVGIDQTTPGTTNGVVVNSSALPTNAATSALQTTGNASLATIATAVATNGGAAPTAAVSVGTFAATSTPLTWTSVTTQTTFGPWTPQLGRDIWSVFTPTGGSFSAVIGITMTGSCSAATPLTSANGTYNLGTFSAAANEDIGAETRASAKWCVTVTPASGASVTGGLYQ